MKVSSDIVMAAGFGMIIYGWWSGLIWWIFGGTLLFFMGIVTLTETKKPGEREDETDIPDH